MTEIVLALRAVGVWTPGLPDVAAWSQRHLQAAPPAGSDAPRAELLPPMLRRRTSLLTRMAAEVAHQAMQAAADAVDPRTLPVIYGSVFGEIRTTIDILHGMLDPAAPMSPTRFHNSVHNTAAGYVSIATQNRSGNAALTAGRSTVAMGLLECAGLALQTGGPVLLVIAEEPLPEPLAAGRRYGPLAVACVVAPAAVPGDMSLRTCRLRQDLSPPDCAPAVPPDLQDNPCAPALALVDAALRPGGAVVPLEPHLPPGARGWQLALEAL